ncbi:CGNR zinc finger protein [Murinocardiopsis flavida]|uniref:CGNR zinc finger protein n=1 Tax=Murinocardiopsis flavida TaxID=645275 RepID=A0A2P8DGX6_9ACTN|nr:CGNR zinc finger domain-containing protein [Murinocardiopsis flavida]PSK96474.1 CGNR zinc finger protein [Murinocardiopsis flavida]
MHFNTYGGTGASVAVDLLNAADRSAAALVPVLRANEIVRPDIDADQARRLMAWIERLRPLFGEPDRDAQIALINQLLRESATCVQVSTHDGAAPHLHYVSQVHDTAERLRGTTAGGLAVAICGAGGDRLGCCARDGCPTVFIDTSRNGRRRFCSVTCANRVNVAAHRARSAVT